MLQLTVSPKAESDLIGIWVYTCEQWGVDQADKYLDQLDSGMKRLVEHPLLGADYTHVFPEYRRLQVEHHSVFYKVQASQIIVIRVLHQEMDAPDRLMEQ